jgi:beta-glucanase (GH16 family)
MKRRKNIFTAVLSALMVLLATLSLSACDLIGEIGSVVSEFHLSKTSLTLEAGESWLLTTNSAGEVKWFSANERVATVEGGEVTGVGIGTTEIVAVAEDGRAECLVTVTGESVITLSAETAIVGIGGTAQITATTSVGEEIKWTSMDQAVATVADGLITGVAAGTTQITATAGEAQAACTVTVQAYNDLKDGYTLVWSDEFDGDELDMNNWSYQIGTQDRYGSSQGPSNWGNNELQSYQQENVKVADGVLAITAKKQESADGKNYTSGRILTRGKFSCTYGYIEARIKSPKGDGMWPAFWMLPQPTGTDSTANEYGGWARNGEIDIMEAKGRLLNQADTTLHFGGYYPENTYTGKTTTLASDIDEWHTYAVDWTKEYIAWVIDGAEVFRLTYQQWWTSAVSSDENPYAPFDKPFYILLNLAVGGTYDPAGTANFLQANTFTSATMYVDYVRVYTPNS